MYASGSRCSIFRSCFWKFNSYGERPSQLKNEVFKEKRMNS
jgi:hypothetical protein